MSWDFITLDSGRREQFTTGARRDVQAGKGRFDLIPYYPMLRFAQLLERGAAKYGDNNWRKGMPLSVMLNSAARHLGKLIDGQTDEDHAAAVIFNVFAFMQYQHDIERGVLPRELDDTRKEDTCQFLSTPASTSTAKPGTSSASTSPTGPTPPTA